eukprot:CAMPEP_0172085016 /NCGR_PEP_ID=MMETSP1043-20130122/21313_1 /TAXON_ID=464988 /ORGANISM="Hemiselmis andersenii, Strain CCMP441" /LENGTH=227 /DNA_ID=CAMNT_0012746901 /DNA_START=18 /DNA_END=698 /DNA_ORIENTATION=+
MLPAPKGWRVFSLCVCLIRTSSSFPSAPSLPVQMLGPSGKARGSMLWFDLPSAKTVLKGTIAILSFSSLASASPSPSGCLGASAVAGMHAGGDAWWGRSYPWENLSLDQAHTLPDYYGALGLEERATPAEVKAAYRKRALLCHPDKNPSEDAMDRFSAVQDAFDVLGDESARASYLEFMRRASDPKLAQEREELKQLRRQEADRASGWSFGGLPSDGEAPAPPGGGT